MGADDTAASGASWQATVMVVSAGSITLYEAARVHTQDTVRQMLVEYFELDPTRIDGETNLTSLGVDSISLMEFVFRVEDHFDVTLPDLATAYRSMPLTLNRLVAELDTLVAARQGPAS
jgi:acyl carrier protein